MDPQQLATKVSQLESRVATLEDEGKIVRGEVKQILTEIRTAILVRDNPFEAESSLAGAPPAHMAAPVPPPAPAAVQEIHVHTEPAHTEPKHEPAPAQAAAPKEPVMLRPAAPATAAPAAAQPEPERAAWSLMTIAGLSDWVEDAARRLGSLRLEILLDLCEAAGHITPEARTALSRINELEIAEPEQPPSTNDTLVILRQLDALVNDAEDDRQRLYRAA